MDNITRLLEENNLLLKKIIEQNQLIFEITQINIKSYSRSYPWYQKTSSEVKDARKLRKELVNLISDMSD